MFRYFYYIFAIMFSFALQAQNPVFEHMANVSELPDVEFYDVLEDEENYIWLAADKGLYRYNGQSYQRFSHPDQKANSLFQLKLDSNGVLWCNNIYGQIFYVENNSLKLFYDASNLVKGQLATYMFFSNSIRLFTITGVYDIDKISKNITKPFEGICLSTSSYNKTSYVFAITLEGALEKHCIYKLDSTKKTKILEIEGLQTIQSPKLFAFKKDVFFTYKSQQGNIVYLINKDSNTTKKIKTPDYLKDETIYNLLKFENNYWFLTTSGVFVYQYANEKLLFKEQLFKTESITDVIRDFNNNYWFTTLDNGVFVSPNLNIRSVELNTLSSKITASCTLPNNQFVLGTNNGKLLFYNTSTLYKTLQLPGKKIIGNLFYDAKKQQLIVSINASESFVIDLTKDEIKDTVNKFSVAKAFSKIDDNTLFYGNYKEGIIYNKPFSKTQKKVIRSSRVKASVVTNKMLFVAYIDGLFSYNLNNFSSKEIQFNNKKLLVNSIAKTENTVWLATQHNGLLYYKDKKLFQAPFQFPKQIEISNLKSDGIFLWISTEKGLYRYNTKTNNLKTLNAQDGLNAVVNNFIILQDYIIVTLPKWFYILPKSNVLFKEFNTSKVRVEAVRINDKDTIVQPNYKLPYHLNKIGLRFNSNGFQSNQNVIYKYRVQQIDSSWQSIPANTQSVQFNSLPNGKYIFELKAKNVSATNAVFATPITFVITKPFWQTYWFYTMILLAVITMIWLYFRWRLKQKENQRIIEIDKILMDKKITNLRLENLRSQMNPHFIFNALNSIQDYIISNEKELASSYLVKFSRLIRIYLDYSQQNEITLQQELNALKLYLELEKVRFEEELDYCVKIDERLKTNQIKVPSLFIQPYVENALKHGLLHKPNDRKLLVEAKIIQQNKLQITIEDNGIGRVQSEKIKRANLQHKPFATKANEERVHLYKNKLKRDITIAIEDLYDANQTPSGTKVVITMPIP